MNNYNFDINFVTFSPTLHYVDYIGGSMVTHNLAHNLAILGENSFIYANTTKSDYKGTPIPWNSLIEYDQENTIIIYPSGDGEHTYQPYIPQYMLDINNRIRWLMNNQVNSYPNDDKLYKFVDYFKTQNNQNIDGYLMAIDVDLTVFKNHNIQRQGNCYYTKGIPIINKIHNDKDICLDNIYHLSSEDRINYLVSVFNKCKIFFCYSNKTFIAILAALCGCIVIVSPSVNLSKEEWKKGFPTLGCGVAYGEEDIEHALNTLPLVKDHVLRLKQQSLEQTKIFINDCYSWLKNKYNL